MLSVVIPAYNEEETIPKTVSTIDRILSENEIGYELIIVNDGSSDNTWNIICDVAANNPKIHGISFSRNFGKESAIIAGLSAAKGDCAVVIDCDLQHPPEKIVEMFHLWEQGYQIVEGIKTDRGKETGFHRFAAKTFYKLISDATNTDMSHASDYKLLDRSAVNVLINMPEKNAFFRALSSWIGFRSIQVKYEVQDREAGKSKWSTQSLIQYALTNITSFTSVPMQIVTMLGMIMFVLGLFLSIQALYKKMLGVALGGFTTVIILQCFSSSIIMISLGIIGYYIAKIYDQVKGRPRYIIAEEVNCPRNRDQKN